jgi:hypothetical protein
MVSTRPGADYVAPGKNDKKLEKRANKMSFFFLKSIVKKVVKKSDECSASVESR